MLVISLVAAPAWGKVIGIAGYAGVPGTDTCADCHGGGSFSGELFVSVPEDIVANDPEVTIEVYYEGTAPELWGFNLIAIDDATDEPVGELVAGSGSKTLTSGDSEYLTHTASGTGKLIGSDPGWSVGWVPPAEPVASVRFYATFNAGNGNFFASGDTIFASSETVVSVPEPGSLGAAAVSLLVLLVLRRREIPS